jgi:hypothetical protein
LNEKEKMMEKDRYWLTDVELRGAETYCRMRADELHAIGDTAVALQIHEMADVFRRLADLAPHGLLVRQADGTRYRRVEAEVRHWED